MARSDLPFEQGSGKGKRKRKTPLNTGAKGLSRNQSGKTIANTGARGLNKKAEGASGMNTGFVGMSRKTEGTSAKNTGFVGMSRKKDGRSIKNTGIVELYKSRKKGTTETSRREPTAAGSVGNQPRQTNPDVRELSNIRRRYRRAAERNEREAQAQEEAGNLNRANQLRSAAQSARNYAESLQVRNLTTSDMTLAQRESALARAVSEEKETSMYQNARMQGDFDSYSNQLAAQILSSGRAGQFYASTKDLWINARGDRNEAIVQAFQEMGYDVTNILDVMQILEDETGIKYLSPTTEQQAKEEYKSDQSRTVKVIRRRGRAAGKAAA